ncbi:DUF982 domain-containing protein [Pararhizobium arenae]|uniref:DUF982 domain-containing protein n=1 Tax=Pararhizobium arenae TaxID=1856850 RepID=UPI00094ABF30|nr:DUF982 domain-containing protein [Pararhizobium arenae]
MRPDMFKKPVHILVGLGFPLEVQTAAEAYKQLLEWPTLAKDASYKIALNACRAAMKGDIEAETARGLYAAFAEKHDLLLPSGDPLIAMRQQRDRDGHIR